MPIEEGDDESEDEEEEEEEQGPRTPKGGCTGVLVSEMEGRGPFFSFARVVTYTPQKYAQSTQLVERITMVTLVFSKGFDFKIFFIFL